MITNLVQMQEGERVGTDGTMQGIESRPIQLPEQIVALRYAWTNVPECAM